MSVFLSLLVLAFSSQDDLSRLVTAEVKAASAPVAIAELSKQVGFPLEAMPSTKDDFLIIRVEKVPLGVLMDKISKATKTMWEKRERGYRLVRNAETLRAEAATERNDFHAEVQAALDKTRKEGSEESELSEKAANALANQMFDWQDRQSDGRPMSDFQAYQRMLAAMPVNRLARSIASRLDANAIAAVPMNRRIVYSTQPNRMQRPFPGKLDDLWQTYLREQDVWNNAYRAVRDRRQGQERFFMGASGSLAHASKGRVIVGITRQSENSGVILNLLALDSRDRVISTASETIARNPQFGVVRTDIAKMGADETPIKFEGFSRKLYDAMQQAYASALQNNGQPNMEVGPDVKAVLLQPDRYEPLGLLPSDAIIGASKAKGLNLVCSASDSLFMAVGIGTPGEMKPAQLLATLSMLGNRVEMKDGWMTVSPKIPSFTRRTRSNRIALGQFYRQCDKEGRISLDNQANYAFRSGLEDENYMHMIVLMLTGILREGVEYGSDWSASRLFGSLTAAQRQAVRREQPIPLRAFSPEQVEILRHHLFDKPYTNFQVTYRPEDFRPEDSDGQFYGMADNEATEVLPNGLTGNESFSIADQSEPRFFSIPDQDGTNGIRFGETALTAQGIAYEMFQNERPEMFPWRNQQGFPQRTFSKFRIGSQRTVTIRAEITPRVSINMSLREKLATGTAVPLDKLPDQHRKAINDELARLREQYKNMKPPEWNPGTGGTRPPPPR